MPEGFNSFKESNEECINCKARREKRPANIRGLIGNLHDEMKREGDFSGENACGKDCPTYNDFVKKVNKPNEE